MPIKNACFDWNGTLFEPATDESLNKAVAYAVLNDTISAVKTGKIWRLPQLARLWKGRNLCKEKLEEYKNGKIPLQQVYKPFNEFIVSGAPLPVIYRAFDQFAEEHSQEVDKKMLEPLKEFSQKGTCGILSSSQDHVIQKTLRKSGYQEIFPTSNIVANYVKHSKGKAVCFMLNIYGEKASTFEDAFLKGRDWKPEETLYSGDTEDDLPVASLLPKGHFVAPFLATDDFKQLVAEKYGAFVPEDQQDLTNYLKKS